MWSVASELSDVHIWVWGFRGLGFKGSGLDLSSRTSLGFCWLRCLEGVVRRISSMGVIHGVGGPCTGRAQVAQISSAQRMKPLGLIVAHSDCYELNSSAFRI